jgi:hypothetical protein
MILYLCFHDAGPSRTLLTLPWLPLILLYTHSSSCWSLPPPPPSFFSLKFSFDFLILYLFLLLLSWIVLFCLSREFSPDVFLSPFLLNYLPMSTFPLLFLWLFPLCHLLLLFSRFLLMPSFSLYFSSSLSLSSSLCLCVLLFLLPVPLVISWCLSFFFFPLTFLLMSLFLLFSLDFFPFFSLIRLSFSISYLTFSFIFPWLFFL